MGYFMKLIGRVREQGLLKELLNSGKAEFLAVYGRRRIGKTFLIREYFKSKNILFFNSSGIKDGALSSQLLCWSDLCISTEPNTQY